MKHPLTLHPLPERPPPAPSQGHPKGPDPSQLSCLLPNIPAISGSPRCHSTANNLNALTQTAPGECPTAQSTCGCISTPVLADTDEPHAVAPAPHSSLCLWLHPKQPLQRTPLCPSPRGPLEWWHPHTLRHHTLLPTRLAQIQLSNRSSWTSASCVFFCWICLSAALPRDCAEYFNCSDTVAQC